MVLVGDGLRVRKSNVCGMRPFSKALFRGSPKALALSFVQSQCQHQKSYINLWAPLSSQSRMNIFLVARFTCVKVSMICTRKYMLLDPFLLMGHHGRNAGYPWIPDARTRVLETWKWWQSALPH